MAETGRTTYLVMKEKFIIFLIHQETPASLQSFSTL